MRTTLVAVLAIVGVTAVVAVAAATAGDGRLPPELRELRSIVAKYHSFTQAQRDGYTVHMEPCVASPPEPVPPGVAPGTMGIHAVHPALMADDRIDVNRPEILLYVPKANGKLKLVGVEYWKRDADQNLGTDTDRPSVFGRGFDGPMPGHGPPGAMPIHYDLHIWVAERNPNGVFAPFNPAISC